MACYGVICTNLLHRVAHEQNSTLSILHHAHTCSCHAGTVDERAINTGHRGRWSGSGAGTPRADQQPLSNGHTDLVEEASTAGVVHDPVSMSAAAAAAITAAEAALGPESQVSSSPPVHTPSISHQRSATSTPMPHSAALSPADLVPAGPPADHSPSPTHHQPSGPTSSDSLAPEERAENWTLAFSAARSLGCTMRSLTMEQLILCKVCQSVVCMSVAFVIADH